MPRLKRRFKVISIRLSGEEYDQLQNLCVTTGADSISELARRAMKLFVLQDSSNDSSAVLESRFVDVYLRISVLDREIARLSDLIGVARPDESQPRGNGSAEIGDV